MTILLDKEKKYLKNPVNNSSKRIQINKPIRHQYNAKSQRATQGVTAAWGLSGRAVHK